MPELVSLRCPNCGAPIHAGDITCEYCGAAHFRLGELDEMEDYARRVARLTGDAKAWEQVMKEYRGEFD
jgi:uncharacterized Zn finger protein (UPF0148 family)